MVNNDSRRDDRGAGYTRFVAVGFSFMFIIAAFTVGGYLLDSLFGTLPLLLLLGIVIGFAGALYYLFVTLGKVGR